jgi:hypothetical protein
VLQVTPNRTISNATAKLADMEQKVKILLAVPAQEFTEWLIQKGLVRLVHRVEKTMPNIVFPRIPFGRIFFSNCSNYLIT